MRRYGSRAAAIGALVFVVLVSACGGDDDAGVGDDLVAGTPTVVFDIDGTLSTESLDPVTVRAGGPEAVAAWEDKGYNVVLLSSRPEFLRDATSLWLRVGGFGEHELILAERPRLTDNQTVEFKTEALRELAGRQGLRFVYGYGDSTTDFEAYAAVGIPRDNVYALLHDGETACNPGAFRDCLPDFTVHLPYIQSQTEIS